MEETTIMASRFKAECLALLDRVERTKVPLVVTKHGRPIARVVPMDQPEAPRDTEASVTLNVAEDAAYYSTDESWSAEG